MTTTEGAEKAARLAALSQSRSAEQERVNWIIEGERDLRRLEKVHGVVDRDPETWELGKTAEEKANRKRRYSFRKQNGSLTGPQEKALDLIARAWLARAGDVMPRGQAFERIDKSEQSDWSEATIQAVKNYDAWIADCKHKKREGKDGRPIDGSIDPEPCVMIAVEDFSFADCAKQMSGWVRHYSEWRTKNNFWLALLRYVELYPRECQVTRFDLASALSDEFSEEKQSA